MFVSVTRGIFVLCHHIIVNLFVRKPELNGANLPNFDLNSCHFCPSFFCPPTVRWELVMLEKCLIFYFQLCYKILFVICLHFDSLVDILTNATSSSAMSL
jgi:hypothetical protein